MSIAVLLLKEALHRKLNFLLGVLAVCLAVALFVALFTSARASENETRLLMRNMGFNLLIVPADTNMEDFWAKDFADKYLPEDYVKRAANAREVSADHYVARLEGRVRWRGRQVLLTGLLPELGATGKRKKTPMGFTIQPGTAYVGYEIAQSMGLKTGDVIEVLGKKLEIMRCLGESGSKDDIRIYAQLHDVQEMLGKPGKINSILALGCLCFGSKLADIRSQMAEALPETRVTEFRSIAVARAETRQMVERHAAFIAPIILVVCAAWVGLLALLNVRERQQEIGILRALGFDSGRIGALFLGRAVVIGLAGAVVGFALGTWLALEYGPSIFKLTAARMVPTYGLLGWSLLVAPLVSAVAGFLPTMLAVMQDPSVTLTQE